MGFHIVFENSLFIGGSGQQNLEQVLFLKNITFRDQN